MKVKPKKIFILAYTKQNLGDDLFVYMLLKRYPNIQFHINIENSEYAKAFAEFKNLTINYAERRDLTKENLNDYDGYIYIGGSIFMEGIGTKYIITEDFLEFMKECKKQEVPFYYISSNFGPYYSKEYLQLANSVFENCTGICFRDTYSANLFKGIQSVQYAPDFAFSYNPEKVEKENDSVGISIIDLSIRKKYMSYVSTYYTMLSNNIKEYIAQGKKITLFSFCKREGDERAIEELMGMLSDELKQNINIIKYDGDLEYFLREYSKMEYMICARFHAMILSSIMRQKCEIMSYSDKIDNVINDLELFQGNVIHFDELFTDKKIPLEDFKQVEESKLKQIIEKSNKQLEEVSKFLES